MAFNIVLKNIKTSKLLVLDSYNNREVAENYKKNWRTVLGGKRWTVERRPGLDTLDHLGLSVMSDLEIERYEKDQL